MKRKRVIKLLMGLKFDKRAAEEVTREMMKSRTIRECVAEIEENSHLYSAYRERYSNREAEKFALSIAAIGYFTIAFNALSNACGKIGRAFSDTAEAFRNHRNAMNELEAKERSGY